MMKERLAGELKLLLELTEASKGDSGISDALIGYAFRSHVLSYRRILNEIVYETPPEPVAYRWKWDKHLEWHYGEYLSQRDYYASEPLYRSNAAQSEPSPKEKS